jgi:hypothetical protein
MERSLRVLEPERPVERCEFIGRCPDVERMRKSRDEGLLDQYDELCTVGGYGCSRRDAYLEARR